MAPNSEAGPPVDLRQVLYFVTVAEELSFTRAAGRLHISTPALSQQVKALERSVGSQLLLRDTHHVRLTPAGEVFAEAGRRLLEEGASAVARTRVASGLVSGRLAVAALHESEPVLEPFLTRFHATYPEIQLTITTMRQAELVAALRAGNVDIGFTWSYLLERAPDIDGLSWHRVAEAEIVAAVHPDCRLAAQESVTRGESLRDMPTVLFERNYSPPTYDYVLEQLYGADCQNPPVREIQVTVRVQESLIKCITTGEAIAPMLRQVAQMLGGTLLVRPFDPPWKMHCCAVWQRDDTSAALLALTTTARSV